MGQRDLLGEQAIQTALAGIEWERDGDSLVKRVTRRDFRDAIAFVRQVAEIAEAMDHHPDIDIRWRTVTLRVSTHSSGGLTQMDVDFAHAVDRLPGPD